MTTDLEQAPEGWRCPNCKFKLANVSHKEKCVEVTCRGCFHKQTIALLAPTAPKVVKEVEVVKTPDVDYGKADFYFDQTNMITAPRTWYNGRGLFLRPEHTDVVCAYVTKDGQHIRFPANLHNIEVISREGIAKRHLSGIAGERFTNTFMDRWHELEWRKQEFERAERVKLKKGKDEFTLFGQPVEMPVDSWVDTHTADGRHFYYQQKAAVVLAVRVKRALLAYEQRTGKTPTMQAIIQELKDNGEIDVVMVIAPVRLLNTAWEDEFERYWPESKRVIMRSEKSRLEAINYEQDVYLSSFESASVNWSVIRRLHHPSRVMVICDETIKLKNPKARRTLGTMRISQEVDYFYELSGAPVSRLHEDVWAQAYCIDPGILGDHYDAFSNSFFSEDYAGRKGFRKHRKATFHELTKNFMLRCTRGEAEQFSGRDTYTVNVKLKASAMQATVYHEMLNSYMAVLETATGAELESEAQNILVQLLRLREILSGFFSFEVGPDVFARARIPGNPKVEWLKGKLDSSPGQQGIIFCEFNEGEAIIADTLDELGIKWGGLLRATRERSGHYGQRAYGSRDDIFADHVRDFQAGDIQIFVGKHSSIGHGLTLSAADWAAFWNMGFNSDNYDQARMRPVAGGKCALIYHLMIAGSIETEHIYPALRSRGDMKATVLQDAARQGYYSFFEQLSKETLQVAAATEYDNDTLEVEARKITGYSGSLVLSDLQTWLRGDSPVLARLDMVRSAGSTSNAYRKVIGIYSKKLDDESQVIASLAESAKVHGWDWEMFLTEVCDRLIVAKHDRRTDDKMFDLMIAYLRMKCVNDIGVA